MVIVETQEIESPEIENNSGFSVGIPLSTKEESTMGLAFFVFQNTFFDLVSANPSSLF